MGTDELVDEIFEIEDKFGAKLSLNLFYAEHFKQRELSIESLENKQREFVITKPIAKKIIKELTEEFFLKKEEKRINP